MVCRQLGFPGAIAAPTFSPFGDGSGPVVMSKVQCTGSEKTIQQCPHNDWVNSGVDKNHEVGVVCMRNECHPDDSRKCFIFDELFLCHTLI